MYPVPKYGVNGVTKTACFAPATYSQMVTPSWNTTKLASSSPLKRTDPKTEKRDGSELAVRNVEKSND